MKKVDDNFIIETNRVCYDKLGNLYTDGADDLETLIRMGVWEEFLNNLDGKKILDVGCGNGDAVKWLVERGYEVSACDLSEEMVKVTKQNASKAKVINCGATELVKIGDNNFDGIVAIHLVQHLSRTMLKKFFNDVYDLLSNDGKFLLVFTNTCYEKTGYQPDGGAIDDNFIFWHKWRMEDVVPMMTKAGLKPTSYRLQKGVDGGCAVDAEPFVFICEKVARK